MSPIKSIGLNAAALLLLLFVLNIPVYKAWWKERILYYWAFIMETKDLQSESYRKEMRYGGIMVMSRDISKLMETNKVKAPVILLPPSGLVKQEGIEEFLVPEPAVFYYFSNLKSVWSYNSTAYEANWAITVHNRQFALIQLNTPEIRDSVINYFNQFKY